MAKTETFVRLAKQHAYELTPRSIFDHIPPDASWILLGEASHGTKEFYDTRAEVSKLLIEERGFNAVCAEADWPDAFRVNLWARGLSSDSSADEALQDFKGFPTWMWRNFSVVAFMEWLRDRNTALPEEQRRLGSVGFYGLDVYSLQASAEHVIHYLERMDPPAAKRARARYSCFDRYGSDAMLYGLSLLHGRSSCENSAVDELVELLRKVEKHRRQAQGHLEQEEFDLAAEENARVVVDAEAYYRNMFFKEELTWNIRDKHMADTAGHIAEHLKMRGIAQPKLIIWAHNSHLGDARYTDMGKRRGEVNLGQLLRERYGTQAVFNIGFTTHAGWVAAADEWGGPVKKKRVRASMEGSYEHMLHAVGRPAFGLDLRGAPPQLVRAGQGPLLERAIGVIYLPQTERWSHYFEAWLPQQFDMVLHFDKTAAVEPLEGGRDWDKMEEPIGEVPETYPFGV